MRVGRDIVASEVEFGKAVVVGVSIPSDYSFLVSVSTAGGGGDLTAGTCHARGEVCAGKASWCIYLSSIYDLYLTKTRLTKRRDKLLGDARTSTWKTHEPQDTTSATST